MKKLFVVVLAFLFLSGCSSKVPTPDDVDKIGKGMDEDKVVEILGEPSSKTTDRKEIENQYYAISTVVASNTDTYYELSVVSDAINNKENVEVYDYETDKENQHIIVFFVDDEAQYFYSVDYGSSDK